MIQKGCGAFLVGKGQRCPLLTRRRPPSVNNSGLCSVGSAAGRTAFSSRRETTRRHESPGGRGYKASELAELVNLVVAAAFTEPRRQHHLVGPAAINAGWRQLALAPHCQTASHVRFAADCGPEPRITPSPKSARSCQTRINCIFRADRYPISRPYTSAQRIRASRAGWPTIFVAQNKTRCAENCPVGMTAGETGISFSKGQYVRVCDLRQV